MNRKFGAVILAAGMAKRMGQQKLLLPLAGKSLLSHVLATVRNLPWADCIAVIGEPEAELAALCQDEAIRSIYNEQRQQGQTTSITLALQQLACDLDGIIFLLGDQPLVTRTLIQTLLTQFEQVASNKAILVPCYQGRRYSPVLFGSYWRPALAALTGDIGGRQIMRDNSKQVTEVNWSEEAAFYDADTWEDYRRFIFEFDKRR
jgi:molybdenum cofactor cytidylyltransferase